VTTRASIIIWSAGGGVLLGIFLDAVLIGLWALVSSAAPALAPRHFPKWVSVIAVLTLTAIPAATGVLGYLEGRLKVN
jgi:hypothetical protein